jgi:FkbM family methyltransferase
VSSLVDRISSHRWVHHVVGALGIYRMAGPVLRRFPLMRRLEPSGIVYRITSLDQIGIAAEVFGQRAYAVALDFERINTFVDLGCNAGWFALFLAAERPNPGRAGLLMDANQRIVDEARWHIERNGLQHHEVVFGAVGLPAGTREAVFHISPSASQSSLLEHKADVQLPVKGRIIDVTVPAISVAEEWRKRFDGPIDLVKIDIEGNELDFIQNEGGFLRNRAHAVLLEWHKWQVTLSELDAALGALGFARVSVSGETPTTGVALYRGSGVSA